MNTPEFRKDMTKILTPRSARSRLQYSINVDDCTHTMLLQLRRHLNIPIGHIVKALVEAEFKAQKLALQNSPGEKKAKP
jgi:hypothetical protein